jgi:hypothetical protein
MGILTKGLAGIGVASKRDDNDGVFALKSSDNVGVLRWGFIFSFFGYSGSEDWGISFGR